MSSPQERVQHYIGQLDREVKPAVVCALPRPQPVLIRLPFQLAKYPTLINLEKQTSVPKAYAFLGLVTLYFFFIVFNLGGQLLTNFAGFVIPGYYSLEALFTTTQNDDTQWLTVSILLQPPASNVLGYANKYRKQYWVVFALFTYEAAKYLQVMLAWPANHPLQRRRVAR